MDLVYNRVESKLQEHGVYCHALMLIGYVAVCDCAGWAYEDILREYAAYVRDAPERIHANLCYRLLKAGQGVGPAQYLDRLRSEVDLDED